MLNEHIARAIVAERSSAIERAAVHRRRTAPASGQAESVGHRWRRRLWARRRDGGAIVISAG